MIICMIRYRSRLRVGSAADQTGPVTAIALSLSRMSLSLHFGRAAGLGWDPGLSLHMQ